MNPFEDTLHSLYNEPNDLITQNDIDSWNETKEYYDKKQQDINTFLR